MKDGVKGRGQSEQSICNRILQAIFEQRMPPGARLTEEALAEAFAVSRTVIRQVIARLSQDGILVKRPSGATHVACPTRSETKQMLAVRRMIEPEIVRTLVTGLGTFPSVELLAHLDEEDNARRAGNRGRLVRLTGEFHLHLARLTKNEVLVRLMMELQALIRLAILLYAQGDDACPEDDHRRIVDAVARGNASLSVEIMNCHLNYIEHDLQLDEPLPEVSISSTLDWLRVSSV